MVQPPPSTQAPGASDAQYSATVLQALLPGAQADQVAPQALQAAADRVHVRVAEGGQRQPPAQVDDPGPPPGQLPYLVIAAHGLDDPVPDRDGRTNPDGCADVRILPPPSTSSASLLLTAQASHTAGDCDPMGA